MIRELIDKMDGGRYAVKGFKQIETSRMPAWNFTLYADGTKLAYVENRGDGGMTWFTYDEAASAEQRERFRLYAARAHLREQAGFEGRAVDEEAIAKQAASALAAGGGELREVLGGEFEGTGAEHILEAHEELKHYIKKCATNTLIRLQGQPAGAYKIYKGQSYTPQIGDKIRAHFAAQPEGSPQLEEIFNEALAPYIEAQAAMAAKKAAPSQAKRGVGTKRAA